MAAILDFQFGHFRGNRLWGTPTGTCTPNLVKIRLTVRKLLRKLISIGFALKVPQNWGFWPILGQNLGTNISHPNWHFLSPKHAFWRIICPNRTNHSEVIKISLNSKMADGGHLEFSIWRMFLWNCLLEVQRRTWHAKRGANQTNRLEVIQILVFSRWRGWPSWIFVYMISEQ